MKSFEISHDWMHSDARHALKNEARAIPEPRVLPEFTMLPPWTWGTWSKNASNPGDMLAEWLGVTDYISSFMNTQKLICNQIASLVRIVVKRAQCISVCSSFEIIEERWVHTILISIGEHIQQSNLVPSTTFLIYLKTCRVWHYLCVIVFVIMCFQAIRRHMAIFCTATLS